MTWPTRHDFHIYRGDDWARTITFADPAGAVIDVSSRTFAAQIRATADSATILATMTVTMTQAALGIVEISLSAAQTAALEAGVDRWDLSQTVSGLKTTLLAGAVYVEGDVTR